MTLILPLLLIALLVYMIYRRPFFRLAELPLWTAHAIFLLKVCFGFALWAVYTFYYTDRVNSDIYKFYDDAHYVRLAYTQDKDAWIGLMTGSEDSSLDVYTSQMKNWERNFNKSVPFNENRFMIRLNAVMMFLSGENIHVHTVLFCFLSFMGCMYLMKCFQLFLEAGKKKWVVLTILFPSFLFWTSGGLKESLVLLGMGFLLFGFLFIYRKRVVFFFALLGGIFVLLMTKYFLLLCLIPGLVAYYIFNKKVALKPVAIKYTAGIVVTLAVIIAIAPINRKINFARIISVKQRHAIEEALYMKAGSYSEVPVVSANILSVLISLPVGICNTMVKPYLWQSRNPMMMLSAAENIVMLLLLLLAIIFRDRRKTYNYNILFFMLISVGLYFSIIGIMTPVIGNLVRYKVVMLPLLAFIVLYIVRPLKKAEKVGA